MGRIIKESNKKQNILTGVSQTDSLHEFKTSSQIQEEFVK